MSQLGHEMFEKWWSNQTEPVADKGLVGRLWMAGWDTCEDIWRATENEIEAIHIKRIKYWMEKAEGMQATLRAIEKSH